MVYFVYSVPCSEFNGADTKKLLPLLPIATP